MYIPETLHHELYNRLAPKVGDILLAKNGTTGIAAIVDREEVFDIYVSLAIKAEGITFADVAIMWLIVIKNLDETKRCFALKICLFILIILLAAILTNIKREPLIRELLLHELIRQNSQRKMRMRQRKKRM